MSDRIKHFEAYIAETADGKAIIDEAARTIRFVISSGAVDRDNEIVQPAAVAASIKEFARNPVCLACHQHRLSDGMPPVVGSWETDGFKATDKRCEMDLRFAVTPLAETYWSLYKDKHMRAVSIGFRVLDGHEVIDAGKRFFVITKIELYEISCVPVGSNREALSKLKALGDWQPDTTDQTKAITDAVTTFTTRLDEVLDELDQIKTLLLPDPGEDLSLPDDEEDLAGDDEKQADDGQKIVEALKTALNELFTRKPN